MCGIRRERRCRCSVRGSNFLLGGRIYTRGRGLGWRLSRSERLGGGSLGGLELGGGGGGTRGGGGGGKLEG